MATGVIGGVFASLVGSISALGLSTALSAQLAEGVWRHDTTCMFATAVVRCELGDTLSGQTIELTLLPLIGLALAAASQLVWRGLHYLPAMRSAERSAAGGADVILIRPLMVFTLLLLTVSCCAIAAQFW
jgi:hypothetical protein